MTTDNDNYPDELNEDENIHQIPDEDYVEIYSKGAIWGFTIFFSTIFGAVLLMQNLKAAGYKRAGNILLLFAIAYTLLSVFITTVLVPTIPYISLIEKIIGGAILTEYIFNKYFPDNDYYPKPIGRALGISLLITLVLAIILAILIMLVPGLK